MKPFPLLVIFVSLATTSGGQTCVRTTTTCDHVSSDPVPTVRRGKRGPRGEKGDQGPAGPDPTELILEKVSEMGKTHAAEYSEMKSVMLDAMKSQNRKIIKLTSENSFQNKRIEELKTKVVFQNKTIESLKVLLEEQTAKNSLFAEKIENLFS